LHEGATKRTLSPLPATLNARFCHAPRTIPAEGDLAVHRRVMLAAIFALTASWSWAAGGLTQEATIERPADIRIGACASPGEVVAPLTPLVVPIGDAQGQPGTPRVEQSVTALPLVLDDILATGHAVAVHASAEQAELPAACGEIGGTLSDDGTLAIGLYTMNGSRVSGTAHFAPTPDGGTTVTLLVIDERAGRRGGEETEAGAAPNDPAVGGGTVGDASTGDEASGGDNTVMPPAAAPAPATAGLDGVTTISASDEDGANAKPDRTKDKASADRDANGNAGTATTDAATDGKARDDERNKREGGASAGEDGSGANG
jgi:hypothetical protein